ncbi:hypothetical protein [uncultured Microbulbifer sp.]|uniref:hypothetical protein n=1 Tax=uncultured Microbulbifer sp. TaxID=348147 RepID=UPI0026063FAF|nr:hypothetical protein [uncultured Microbulbifer sp.]
MKLKIVFCVWMGLGMLAGCSSGAGEKTTGAAQNGSATANLAAAEEEKICKVRAITGSRFKQKTCMTQEEWDRMAYETKKMLDDDTRSKPTNY